MELDFSLMLPYIGLLPAALGVTLKIGIFGFIIAVGISFVVGVLRSKNLPKIPKFILGLYVEFFRCTPLIVQLFFVYYGMPALGIKINPILSSIITMGLNSGAYMSENIRGAILSVDRGQYEAAHILGFSNMQTNVHIVLPQALRVAIPAYMNGFSTMIKETSMASVLPVIELTKLGNQIYAKTYHPFEIYMALGILYFIMIYTMTFVAKQLERKATKWR
jgi:polar amino acid transport system permease protein